MRYSFIQWVCRMGLVCLALLPTSSNAGAPNEISRRLPDVENQFARLRSHADFLGFRHDSDVAPTAGSSPSATHYQGIARSEAKGRPYLFVTRSGTSDRDRGNLMVVRMGSRDSDGERMRSNRLRKGRSVERTEPPELDRVVANIRFSQYHHPGGIQLCGDILTVPLEERTTDTVSEGKVVFFNVQDPENPKRLSVTVEATEKIGVAGLAKLPDGKFLLATTGGDGRYIQFYRSNKESFFEEGFEFVKHSKFDGLGVEDGVWIVGNVSHQTLQLLVEWDGTNPFKVYLMGGYNDNPLVPFAPGSDILTLYEVFGWKSGETVRLKQRDQREMNVTSENWPTVLAESGASKRLANADFLAGLCAYVSPTGEFLVYAIEHYNWGPNESVRFVEFRHEQVYRESNKIFGKQLVLSAPEYVMEDSTVLLDASASERMGSLRPWVELFDHDNYDGRSVIVDWNDRNEEDFDDFRELDGFGDGIDDGFNDRASSVRWFAPVGWKIRLHDQDNLGTDEPTLDLGGIGVQSGIRNLSDKPYEFDNVNGDLSETRVTSVEFLPPDNDYGWTKPMENLTFTWRLLDAQQQPVKESVAKLVPVLRTPWKMNLQTFGRGPEVLYVELTMGPPPGVREVRPIRFLARNRAPILADVSTEALHGGLVNLKVYVKDEDASDSITLHVLWGDGTPEIRFKGTAGGRVFGASHVFTNPDPQAVLMLPFHLEVWVEDQEGASSPTEDRPVRVVWRANTAPVAMMDSVERPSSGEVRVALATLLQNDSDPDGDEFDFAGIRSVAPEGAIARVEEGVLIYTPSPIAGEALGGVDYTLRDQYGKTGVGKVLFPAKGGNVQVPWLRLVGVRVVLEGGVQVEFEGVPGQTMDLLSAPELDGPWTSVGRVTAGADARFKLSEPAIEGARYYRGQSVGN